MSEEHTVIRSGYCLITHLESLSAIPGSPCVVASFQPVVPFSFLTAFHLGYWATCAKLLSLAWSWHLTDWKHVNVKCHFHYPWKVLTNFSKVSGSKDATLHKIASIWMELDGLAIQYSVSRKELLMQFDVFCSVSAMALEVSPSAAFFWPKFSL